MTNSLLQVVLRHAEGLSGSDVEADGELLRRFTATRDETAFEALLRRHGPMVWAVCRQSLIDEADVEDAFQATFLALIRSAVRVRRAEALAGWLHGVAVRVVLKVKRSAARRKQHEHRAAGRETDRSIPESNWDSLLAAVHEEIQRLPEAMRTVFVLCELEGVRQPDAAEKLGCRAGTLTSRLTRARQLLIQRLSNRGLAPAVAGGLGVGLATASAAVPQRLLDKALSLISAGDSIPPAILELASEVTPMTAIRMKLAAATLVAAAAFGAAFFPSAGAQPPDAEKLAPAEVRLAAALEEAAQPAAPQYVPADAAFFVHVDVAKLWSGSLGKSLRDADAQTFNDIAAFSKKILGTNPEGLKTLTIYFPTFKPGPSSFGVIAVFNAPYDKTALKAGFDAIVPQGDKTALESPSDTVAILLSNLDPKKFGKPAAGDKNDPLVNALKEASRGKHLLVAGATLANLPDELRSDDLPVDFRAFKPIFRADSVTAIIDLDKALKVEVRVKAPSAAAAQEAEKSLGAFIQFAKESLGFDPKVNEKEPATKDLARLFNALRRGLEEAKYGTDGTVAWVNVQFAADLPFAQAVLDGKKKVGESAARAQSSNNLKQLAIALHNYESVHGTLPPAAVCDKAGKPMLSWRVLILPYIEQERLYKEFKLDEPWDSEHNKKLIAKMPKTYALPPVNDKATETNYRVFVGNGAAFDYLKGPKFADFADGLSNTLLVVTAKDSVPWTKPDELSFDPDKDMTGLLGFNPGGVCVIALGDGSVRALSKSISKKLLHGTITRNGGEILNFDE